MAFGVGVEHKGESEADKNNPANAKLAKLEAADHAQEGIAIKKRSMTDCLWVFLIIGLWVVMTSIGAKACANGNPSILLYPSDYRENICGHTGSVKENHYAYIVNKQGEATCVEECPSAEPSADAFLAASAVAALGGDQTQPYIDAGFLICKKLEDRDTSLNWQQSIDQGYCSVAYKSSPIMYYCVFDPSQLMQPEDGLNTTVGQYYGLPEGSGAMSEFVSDLTTASGYIFGLGVCLAFLVSIVFTYVTAPLPLLLLLLPLLRPRATAPTATTTLHYYYSSSSYSPDSTLPGTCSRATPSSTAWCGARSSASSSSSPRSPCTRTPSSPLGRRRSP